MTQLKAYKLQAIRNYEHLVDVLIKEKYNQSQENSIIRQKDIKKEEFDEYFNFCEDCKARAKSIFPTLPNFK